MLTFSPAVSEDIHTLFLLNKKLIDAYEDTASIDYDRVLHWVHRNIAENLAAFTRVYWNGALAGFYSLHPVGENMELDSLFLFPQFQNRGIGTAILRKCMSETPSLFLYVFRKNTRALRLYQRLGFEVVKEVGSTRYVMEYENQGC